TLSGSALRGIPLAARHLVLGLMPSAETAAVSASRATGGEQQARRRDPAGAWEYGWPIRLMCVVTALAYFVTGMAKVTGELGWSWVSGEALRSQVAADALRKEVLGDAGSSLFYIVYPQLWLFTCFGVMTLLVELGAPFALLMRLLRLLLSFTAGIHADSTTDRVPSPASFLGFEVGADRKLADWHQISAYFNQLALVSDRVRVDTLGTSTLGRPFILLTISSPENLRRLDEYRAIQRKLADPRTIASAEERRRLLEKGR